LSDESELDHNHDKGQDPQQHNDIIAQNGEAVETKLVLVVGKQIMPNPHATMTHMQDLLATVNRYSSSITCLVGGHPSYILDKVGSSFPISSDVIVGINVAEIDYTSQYQQAFSIDMLTNYLNESRKLLDNNGIWQEIDNKPYISKSNLDSAPLSIYVISTYEGAFVNVVFGVRKIGDKGHQVVGISCKPPERHVCQLEVNEEAHQQLLSLMSGVEGQPLYHLLPEIIK